MSEKRLMRPQEFAEYTDYKLGTIYNKINRGEFLPGLVKIPNQGRGAVGALDFHPMTTKRTAGAWAAASKGWDVGR